MSRMTKKEKKAMQAARKRLREKGLLPEFAKQKEEGHNADNEKTSADADGN